MARPNKTALEYYNVDTNIFQNRKVKKLIRAFGGKGYLIYSYILTEIYRDKGYFIKWDKDTAFDVSDAVNQKENLVLETINFCCDVGLFNKELYTNENVLTSKAIQEFWQDVSKKAKRKKCVIESKFHLLMEETPLNKELTPIKQELTPFNRGEMPQSKVKESKVNNIIDVFVGFKNQISSNEHAIYRETFYRNYKLKKGMLSKIIDLFNDHLILKEITYEELSKYKEHFFNWVNNQDSLQKLKDYKRNTRQQGGL